MKQLLVFILSVAFAVSASGGLRVNAAATGIQYEEISRSIMAGATAPPPGSFQSDLAQVHDGKLVSANPMMAQQPAMPTFNAMSIFSLALNPLGGLMGLAESAMMGSVMSGMMSKYKNYESGQLQRVAYYGQFGRVENLATKHVLITDMQKQVAYDVDESTQSYRLTPFNPERASAAMPSTQQSGAGSADVAVNTLTTKSAGQRIEGIDTDLYDTVTDVTVSNATGKCRNMQMRLETVQFVATSVSTPGESSATMDQILRSHPEMMAGQACVAQVHASGSGPTLPTDRLIVYSRTSISAPEMEAQAKKAQAQGGQVPSWMTSGGPMVTMVTERGNIRPLAEGDVAALFAVPAGFKPQP